MDLHEYLEVSGISSSMSDLAQHLQSVDAASSLNENDQCVAQLLGNIASMGYDERKDKYIPRWLMADGRRTFSMEDITECDLEILNGLSLEKMPLLLRARIADILWILKRDAQAARVAVASYKALVIIGAARNAQASAQR